MEDKATGIDYTDNNSKSSLQWVNNKFINSEPAGMPKNIVQKKDSSTETARLNEIKIVENDKHISSSSE